MESEPMLTPEEDRTHELHQAGQQAQHPTNKLFRLPGEVNLQRMRMNEG